MMKTTPELKVMIEPADESRGPRTSTTLHLYVVGPAGIVSLSVDTGWLTRENWIETRDGPAPLPVDCATHGHRPLLPDGMTLEVQQEDCRFLDGPCWYNGSSSIAMHLLQGMIENGDEWLRTELLTIYRSQWGI